MTVGEATDQPGTSSLERCLTEVRNMILTGELLPGEKVHQADLAAQLSVSRIPLREALSRLQAEGVLTHRPNSGYQVSRFSSEDLTELYLMRRLLETELLRSAPLGPQQADRMLEINERLRKLDAATDPETYQAINHEFHFHLFDASPLRLVREEVDRLWYRSGFYRSLYLHEAPTALQVLHEHGLIIDAVRDEDIEELIRVTDEHRKGTERLAIERLGRSRRR